MYVLFSISSDVEPMFWKYHLWRGSTIEDMYLGFSLTILMYVPMYLSFYWGSWLFFIPSSVFILFKLVHLMMSGYHNLFVLSFMPSLLLHIIMYCFTVLDNMCSIIIVHVYIGLFLSVTRYRPIFLRLPLSHDTIFVAFI